MQFISPRTPLSIPRRPAPYPHRGSERADHCIVGPRQSEREREEQRDGADRRGERENRSREAVLVRL